MSNVVTTCTFFFDAEQIKTFLRVTFKSYRQHGISSQRKTTDCRGNGNHQRIQEALGGRPPFAPQDFFKIMQFSGIFYGEKNLFLANFGLRGPQSKPLLPLSKILDPPLGTKRCDCELCATKFQSQRGKKNIIFIKICAQSIMPSQIKSRHVCTGCTSLSLFPICPTWMFCAKHWSLSPCHLP